MAGRGRPLKYDEALHKAICENLKKGMSRTTAAELAGINRDTLNQWAGSPPDWSGKLPAFSADVRAAIAHAKARATLTITKSIQEGDVPSSWRYLALMERDEWRESTEVNVNHGGTINYRDLSAFNDDEIASLAAIGERVKSGQMPS